MLFHVSHEDGTPIYIQIINQVKYLVASGTLKTGDELPTIRALADQVVVNPNTIARAYRELQTEGMIDKRGTAGSFISSNGSPLAKKEQVKRIEKRIDTLLSDASNMGISVEEIQTLVGIRSKKIKPKLKEKGRKHAV